MIIKAIVFYLFAAIAVAAAALVVMARNPVHSVMFLILCFFTSAGLFVLMGAEFLAMLLIVVYVGAVAVLFLFVVMMLDIDFVKLRAGFVRFLPLGLVVGIVMLAELVLIVGALTLPSTPILGSGVPVAAGVDNVTALGRVLYTDYVYLFQASGMILLVAMIGAIVLTLRQREGVRKQDIATQVRRAPGEAVEVRDIPSGSGA